MLFISKQKNEKNHPYLRHSVYSIPVKRYDGGLMKHKQYEISSMKEKRVKICNN